MDKALTGIDLTKLSSTSVSSFLGKTGVIKSASVEEQKLIVKVKEGQTSSKVISIVKSYGVESINPLNQQTSQLLVVDLEDSDKGYRINSLTTEKQIAKLPDVEYVEIVQTYTALSADSSYPHQWSIKMVISTMKH
jgi:cell wall-associated protease